MVKISPERIRQNVEEKGLKIAFREFLNELVNYYYCSFAEIGNILGDKDNTTAFIRGKESIKDFDKLGSVIYTLIKSLTDFSTYNSAGLRRKGKSYKTFKDIDLLTNEERRKFRQKKRGELKNDCDPDMVLMAFGFLPIESQVIRVDCPARRQKILNLVDILDSGLINDDQFMSLSQIIEEQVALLCQELKDEGLRNIEYVKNEWINERAELSLATPFNKEYIKKEFIRSLESRDLKNKLDFKEIEYMSLYRSIVTKTLRRNQIFRDRNFLLKVKNINFECKYIHIQKTFFELIKSIIHENMANAAEGLEQRVLKVSVELEIYIGGFNKGAISLQSASASTYLGNLQSVMTRGLGSALLFPSCNFRVRALRQSLESLVDCTSVISRPVFSTLTSDDETSRKQAEQQAPHPKRKQDFQYRYWGQWVGRDTFLALAQSLTVALEDGIYEWISEMTERSSQKSYSENINKNLQFFYKTVVDISELKNNVQLQLFYEKPFVVADSDYLQQLIIKIEATINSIFEHINNNDSYSDVYTFMLASLYRIYGLVSLEIFRFDFLNKDGNESIILLDKKSKFFYKNKIRRIINTIENKKYKEREVSKLNLVVDNWLKPISWLYEAESLISQFLTQKYISSTCDLSKSLDDVWHEYSFGDFLNLQPSEDGYQHSYYKYTSPDIYIGLSELLGRLGQLRYYLALPPKSKDLCHLTNIGFNFSTNVSLQDQLIAAQQFLLLAAGYASRTGNAHRMAHWLLLCYRATMRLDSGVNPLIQEAKLLNQVRKYLKVEYHIPSLKIIEGAFKAEHFLTLGEALLIRSQKHNDRMSRRRLIKAGELLIQSLLSAVYLKLNLRLADSLYILGKAAFIFSSTTISVQEVVDGLPNLYKHVLALSLTVPDTTPAQDLALNCLRLFMPYQQHCAAIDLYRSDNINNQTFNLRYQTQSSYDEERESWYKHYKRLNNAAQDIWNSWIEDSGSNHFISKLISNPNSPFLSHISSVDE